MGALGELRKSKDDVKEVLVIDFDQLTCVPATISNMNDWGCRLTSDRISELHKNIGIRIEDAGHLVRGQITAIRKKDAAVVFPDTNNSVADLRREKRSTVDIPVKISNKAGSIKLSGKIVDAAPNGCRIQASGMDEFPDDEVLLGIPQFDKPILGEVVWTNKTGCGLRLIWDVKALKQDNKPTD